MNLAAHTWQVLWERWTSCHTEEQGSYMMVSSWFFQFHFYWVPLTPAYPTTNQCPGFAQGYI